MIQKSVWPSFGPLQSTSQSSSVRDVDKMHRAFVKAFNWSGVRLSKISLVTSKGPDPIPDTGGEKSRSCSSVARAAMVGWGVCVPCQADSNQRTDCLHDAWVHQRSNASSPPCAGTNPSLQSLCRRNVLGLSCVGSPSPGSPWSKVPECCWNRQRSWSKSDVPTFHWIGHVEEEWDDGVPMSEMEPEAGFLE